MPARPLPPLGLLVAFLVASVSAVVVGVIYSLVLGNLPFVNLVTVLAAPGFGLLVGMASVHGLRTGRVRVARVGKAVTMVATALGFYASWVVWVAIVLDDWAWLEIAARPWDLWRTIGAINEVGAWKIADFNPKGAALWSLWLFEAALVFGAAWSQCKHEVEALAEQPYCDACRSWVADPTTLASFELGDEDIVEVTAHVRERRWDYFASFARAADEDRAYTFTLEECGCGRLQTLGVDASWLTPMGSYVCRHLAKRMPLEPNDRERIRELARAARESRGAAAPSPEEDAS